MAIGIALAAEEHGKIVSARHLCNAVKSYLPTHGTFHKIAPCALCIFADAIRKECAEAKSAGNADFHRAGGRNPQGVRRGKEASFALSLPPSSTQSARSAPRQSTHIVTKNQANEDAIRKECAEAKSGNDWFVFPVFRTLRNFRARPERYGRCFLPE